MLCRVFHGLRAGYNPFVYYKFRTMYHNNDDTHHRQFLQRFVRYNEPYQYEREPGQDGSARPVYKLIHDSRVTPRASFAEMLNIDLLYVQQCSLALDLWIVLRTFAVVAKGEGAG
jgi:lipopolysaccharide/colanic/teichoic acid biosynthesis glycosyltransferase